MSINSQGINTSGINSTEGISDTKLYPNVINIRTVCDISESLAIRFLDATGIIGGIRSTAILIKRDSTTFSINTPKVSMSASLARIIPIATSVISLPVPINNRALSYIGTNKPIAYGISAVNINNTFSVIAKRNLSTSVPIKNNCSGALFKKAATQFSVATKVTCNTALSSIKMLSISVNTNTTFNSPVITRLKTLPFNVHTSLGCVFTASGTFGVTPNILPIKVNAIFDIKSILFDKAPAERAYIIPADYRFVIIPEEIKIMEVFKKQPADSYDYDFTYNEWLMGQDYVDNVSIQTFPSDATDVDGLQVNVYNLQGGELKLWISGGKNGVTYKVTLTATTKEHRIKQNEFKLKVKDI